MRHLLLPLAIFAGLCSAPAFAGMSVVGNSLGQECYDDTVLAPNPQRNADALEVCDRAVRDTSVNAWNRAANHVNRAEIRLRVRDFTGALDDAEFALKQNPDLGEAHLNRGAALIGLQRYDEALMALNIAMADGVTRMQTAWFNRGLAEENLGQVANAYSDYKRAAALEFAPAQRQLARFTSTGEPR